MCGCATVYNPATQRREMIFINEQTEVSLGSNASAQINQQKRLSYEAAYVDRVRRIGTKIARLSDRPGLPYQFHVLDDEELNALSLPGGFIYVNKGLVKAYTDDELAYVLGHEIAHVAAKHAVKKIQADMGFQLLLTVAFAALGERTGASAQDIGSLSSGMFNLVSLGYSRADEYLADRLGVIYMHRAGFDPRAALAALRKLEEAGQKSKLLEYFRSHPYPEDRIKALESIIKQLT